jgi:hypothetical protein
MQKMKYNLTGMVLCDSHLTVIASYLVTNVSLMGHLKTHFKAMYQLYEHLKAKGGLSTKDEIAMASRKDFGPKSINAYLTKLSCESNTLLEVFAKQNLKLEVHIPQRNIGCY